MNAMAQRGLGIAVVALLTLSFAWFIWPTPYHSIGPDGMMQVNRFTGVRCPVGESCWRAQRRPVEFLCDDYVDRGGNSLLDLTCRKGIKTK